MTELVKRCDQCRHWSPDGSDHDYRSYLELGQCLKPLQLWNATEWVEGEEDDNGYYRVRKAENGDVKMFVQDGSDYRAELITAPDFFCAHFQAGRSALRAEREG